MNIRMSVKKKVLTILMLSIVVISTLAFIMLKVTFDSSIKAIGKQNFGLSEIFCAGVENELQNMKLAIINFITSDNTKSDIADLKKGMNSYVGYVANRSIDSRLLSDSIIGDSVIGMCYYSDSENCFRFSIPEYAISFIKYDFIESELSDTDYKFVHIPDKSYLYFFAKNEESGYYVFVIDIRRVVRKAYSIYGMRFDSCFTVVSNDAIIYSENEELSNIALDISETSWEKNGFRIVKRDSQRYIVNYVDSSFNNWKYLYVLPTEVLYSEINYVIIITIAIFLVFVVVLFLIAYLVTNKVTEKLSSLQSHMKDMENGVYTVFPQPEHVKDDLDELVIRYNDMVLEIQRLVEVDHKKELLLNQTRFKALKAQINPHFIYNTLETIKCLALEENLELVEEVIGKFGTLLRTTINMPELVALEKELEIVEAYLYIQKVRFGDRLVFTSDIDETYCNFLVPHLILQPLVENSIKHVMEVVAEPNHIHLEVLRDGSFLALSVTDSGKGFDKSKLNSQNDGIGLTNISERLKFCFGEMASLNVLVNSNGNTCVRILIPLEKIYFEDRS